MRVAFILGAIFVGLNLVNYFIVGNTGDYLPGGERMGAWKAAKIREACYPALLCPPGAIQRCQRLSATIIASPGRISAQAKNMTAALYCYLVTHPNAVCEKNNRAYIVDYINRYFAKFDEMIDIANAMANPK